MTIDGVELFVIPGIDNYLISRCGKVWSMARKIPTKGGAMYSRRGRWLKQVPTTAGYPRVTIGKDRLVHRLVGSAFLGLMEDQWIDHKDGDRSNNHVDNLRICDPKQNQWNKKGFSKGGVKGVSQYKKTGRWRAMIRKNGKNVYLGSFGTKEEAGERYREEARKLHGEFLKTA
jgi:hypothetical protein